MEMRLKVFLGSEPLKKAIGAAIWQSRHQISVSSFSACKTQGIQHEIRTAFFELDYFQVCYKVCQLLSVLSNI